MSYHFVNVIFLFIFIYKSYRIVLLVHYCLWQCFHYDYYSNYWLQYNVAMIIIPFTHFVCSSKLFYLLLSDNIKANGIILLELISLIFLFMLFH